jgi:hypothetical protein
MNMNMNKKNPPMKITQLFGKWCNERYDSTGLLTVA